MKHLIREVHRRSLWQVLGVYLAISWIVLQVIDVLGNNIGLPQWVGPTAFALLLVGLPVVIGTAFVQEGMTTRPPEPAPQSPADVGEVPPPAPEPTGHRKLLTWRNALIGGGAAFALLGLATAGYLFLRTSGIGPAGTLVAQGVLEEGAQVVLADFESADPELADVVTGALRIDLVQSPTIRVVPRSRLAGALRRMQRDEDAPLTGDVARELAVREGYGAVIEGEIGSVGSGYVLTASIQAGEGWEPRAAFRATAKGDDDLIDAIEELSREIRDKAGESLRTVRGSPGLTQVTTSSLDALRLYTRAEELENTDGAGAVELYEAAVEIDPEFAMAYRKIGVTLSNLGTRRSDEVAALERALELRERLPPAERYLAEAHYAQNVTGDRQAAIRAYERLLEVAPEVVAGLNNLAVVYNEIGRHEEAESLLERARSIEPISVVYANLGRARVSLGRLDDANLAIDEAVARLPASEVVAEQVRTQFALAAADYDEAAALLVAYREQFPSGEGVSRGAHLAGVLHGIRGELRAADEALQATEGGEFFWAHPMRVARERALLALERGDSTAAVSVLLDAHRALRDSLPTSDLAYGWWLPALVEAGGVREAESLYEEWRSAVPDDQVGAYGADGRRELDARLAFERGDIDGAIRLWGAYERECPAICAAQAAYGLARIHEKTGDAAAAIEEYERYLSDGSWGRWRVDRSHRGPALESLARLYDGQGDAPNAAKYYGLFVELWEDADEELQPRVEAARARLAELRVEDVASARRSGAGSSGGGS